MGFTLPPISHGSVKNGCISNRIVTFQIVRHFPLNHDCTEYFLSLVVFFGGFLGPKTSFSKKKSYGYTRIWILGSPQKKITSITPKTSQKKSPMFFTPPVKEKTGSLLQKIEKKKKDFDSRLRFPAAHDLESWFSVVGLRFFWGESFARQWCYPGSRAEAKQFTLLLVKTVCYAFGFIGFRYFQQKDFGEKSGGVSEMFLTF